MKAVKNYLSVTKKEWNGKVVLVILIALVLIAPYVYQQLHRDAVINFKDFDKAAAMLKVEKPLGNSALSDDKIANPVMFVFNPNHLPVQQWKQLGLSDRQINTIKNYEAKGGHFYTKADVKKIYAITADDYKRLEPYINIPGDEYASNKIKPGEVVELNSADSAKLTTLHGIGPAFAQRIIEYRNRLGGFLNKEQLTEVYGVDAHKYARLKNEVNVSPALITKIKINEVDFEGLRQFPYLTNKQANAIIQYRNQHGNYQSITGLHNIMILDDNILRKIEPYLDFK